MLAFYYAFMSEDEVKGSSEVVRDDELSEKPSQVKILVRRDRRSKCYAAIAVPCKGVDEDEYATRKVLRFLDFQIKRERWAECSSQPNSTEERTPKRCWKTPQWGTRGPTDLSKGQSRMWRGKFAH